MKKIPVFFLLVAFVLLLAGSAVSATTSLPPRWPEPAWFAQFYPRQEVQPTARPEQQPVGQAPTQYNTLSADELIVFEGVNRERVLRGLAPLAVDPALVELARRKSRDMVDNGYFAHRSPVYGTAYDMMRAAGIRYNYAGENIARTTSADYAVRLFMSSSVHRNTLLNPRYSRTGIGIVRDGRQVYVTQMFIGFQ